jgi:hypothetical protein
VNTWVPGEKPGNFFGVLPQPVKVEWSSGRAFGFPFGNLFDCLDVRIVRHG